MTEEQVHNFEKIQAQLDSLYIEISALSKKNQNDALSPFKLKYVNKTLADANIILTEEYKPFDDFQQFDEENIPTNSDVNLILGQYIGCMEKLRADNIENEFGGRWIWVVEENANIHSRDNIIKIRTSPPKKISIK